MIAIDTNVLLRYLLADDPRQYSKATALVTQHSPVLLTDVVLAETVWTLSGNRYGLDKATVCDVVRGLIEDSQFVFEDLQVVWSALCDYEESTTMRGKMLDYADVLIMYKAQHVADALGETLRGYYSFDKAVNQLNGASAL